MTLAAELLAPSAQKLKLRRTVTVRSRVKQHILDVSTYVAIHDSAFLETFWLVVVINAKFFE
jgi:hypothetical protein